MLSFQYLSQLLIFYAKPFILLKQQNNLLLHRRKCVVQLPRLLLDANHLLVDILFVHGLTPTKHIRTAASTEPFSSLLFNHIVRRHIHHLIVVLKQLNLYHMIINL